MSPVRLFHSPISSGRSELNPAESHHFASVLRGRLGDELLLFDGEGHEGVATVVELGKARAVVDVGEISERPFGQRVWLTIATAMPRKHRQGFLFEKCTELGTRAIWPTVCERSVVLPRAGSDERWRRTTIEAAKQCGRCWLPRIVAPLRFSETIDRCAAFDLSVVTDPGTSTTLAQAISAHVGPATDKPNAGATTQILVWVGPEGGLSPDEVATATQAGAVRASLGNTVLRVETAAVAVAAIAAQMQ